MKFEEFKIGIKISVVWNDELYMGIVKWADEKVIRIAWYINSGIMQDDPPSVTYNRYLIENLSWPKETKVISDKEYLAKLLTMK